MLSSSALLAALLPAAALAAPFEPFPLSDGFPTPTGSEVLAIQTAAGGTLSNAGPPPNPGPNGITSLQLIAFNELSEVAFFTQLLENVTNNVPGYEIPGVNAKGFVVDSIKAIQAQEELHALNANGALKAFGQEPIVPCQYQFPVSSFMEAVALANTFTDVVLGTLQDVQFLFSEVGASGLVRAVGSVIGQEGEQNGAFRALQHKTPSAAPFLTTSVRDFAWSALQGFVVPGSCGNDLSEVKLQIFPPLTVETTPSAENSTLTYKVETASYSKTLSSSNNWITYISGQNLPVVVSISDVYSSGAYTTFKADFPFDSGFANGLTIAAVTNSSGPFTSADAVALATVFGPGLIEVD